MGVAFYGLWGFLNNPEIFLDGNQCIYNKGYKSVMFLQLGRFRVPGDLVVRAVKPLRYKW